MRGAVGPSHQFPLERATSLRWGLIVVRPLTGDNPMIHVMPCLPAQRISAELRHFDP